MPKPDSKDLLALARRLLADGPHKTHTTTARRVRIALGGVYIADTTRALYVWEHPYYPFFYIPEDDFAPECKKRTTPQLVDESGQPGITRWSIEAGDKTTDRVICFCRGELKGYVRFEFEAADQWFEEDTPIYVHPKDPFKRVDLVQSQRPVEVFLDGIALAKSSSCIHLYETLLPRRYYIPITSIDPKILRKSDTRTMCPYKGEAEYWHVVTTSKDGSKHEHQDLVWTYVRPTLECGAIAGLACFYNEKVDIKIDGRQEERPKTVFG